MGELVLITITILIVCPIVAIYNVLKAENITKENKMLRDEIKQLKTEYSKKKEYMRKTLDKSLQKQAHLELRLKELKETLEKVMIEAAKNAKTNEETPEAIPVDESGPEPEPVELKEPDQEENPFFTAWLNNKKYELCEKMCVGNSFRVSKEEYPEEIEKEIRSFFESQSEVVAVSVDEEGIYVFCSSSEYLA